MPVLIGCVDQRIQDQVNVGWDTNKIGGLPVWIESKSSASIPECRNCGQPSSLVIQIYCPLGGSSYHRCIYLFACPGVCNKQQHGWRVFRSMKHDSSYQTDIDEVKISQQPSKGVDEFWTQEQDDWGEESSDWGEETHDSCDLGKTPGHYPEILESASKLTSESDTVIKSVDVAEDYVTEPKVQQCVSDSGVYTSCLPQSVESLSQLKLSDDATQSHGLSAEGQGCVLAVSADASSDGCGDGEEPLAIEVVALADTERWNAMAKILNTKLDQDQKSARSQSKCPVMFEPYYLSVVDEPPGHVEESDHVTDLIRHYERSEGKQLHLLITERSSYSKGKEGPSELYEKTELKHGDKMFYKFMKRLQRCPNQCIRYDRGGVPLLVSSLPEHSIDLCTHCGGKRIFEFQLLPPLIPFLNANDGSPCEVDFGTVLVFTCERNCWPADHDPTCKLDLLEESIILQEDPDFHLYR